MNKGNTSHSWFTFTGKLQKKGILSYFENDISECLLVLGFIYELYLLYDILY